MAIRPDLPRGPEEPENASGSRLRRLASELREREETTRSLQVASTRQRSMLPPAPQVEGYEFQAFYLPAATIGGDFYDFFWTRENRLGIVIGDVSGHGIEAGIVMGRAMATLNIYGRQFDSPAEVLRRANADLYAALDGRTFVSLCYSVLDVRARMLRMASAGGLRPLLFNALWQNPTPCRIPTRGVVLGADSGERFAAALQELDLQLYPGDLLLYYTDGIPEAVNPGDPARTQFGEARVEEALARYGRTSAREVSGILLESLKDFTRRDEYEDDITLIACKVG